MQAAERCTCTEDEYVALERRAETKSELINGEIFAMAGAKPKHNVITLNIGAEIRAQLRSRKSPCVVFSSDQRIRSDATAMNTYADVSVACDPRFHSKYTDALVNPVVIVEVLSKSTEGHDRGAKFAHDRTIESLQEYVLVSQRERRVEHFRRLPSGQWILTVAEGEGAVLELPGLSCTIPLEEIYAQAEQLEGDEESVDVPQSA